MQSRRLVVGPIMLSLFVLAALATTTRTAGADEVAQAKEHFVAGTRAFELGAFDDAIAEYSLAYRLRDDPALLYNLGQAHRLAGHAAEALHFYRVFLTKVPDSPNRDEVEEKVEELRKLVDQQRRAQNLPPDGVTPPSSPRAPAGVVVARRRWRPPGRALAIGGITVGSAGVGLLAGGIALGALAHQASDRLTRLDRTMGTFDYDLEQAGKGDRIGAGVLLGVGSLAIVGGAALYLVGHHQAQRALAVRF
jgi:hypothetical protein